jgi:hypothetical protein
MQRHGVGCTRGTWAATLKGIRVELERLAGDVLPESLIDEAAA